MGFIYCGFIPAGAQAAGPWYVATNGADSVNDGLSWSQPFASISNAVANAGAAVNETIWVSNGVYTLTATVTNPTAKACKIRAWSTNPTNTVLIGPGSNDVPSQSFRGMWMSGAGSLLQGFTVTNFFYTNLNQGAGVYCSAGLISNCVIAGNIMSYHIPNPAPSSITASGAGIYITSAGVVENCDIIGNRIATGSTYDGGGGGIWCSGTIRNCRIMDNRSDPKGGGVYLSSGTIQDSVISNNYGYQGGGIFAEGGVISNCLIITNSTTSGGGGIEVVAAASSISIMQCNISGNVGSWTAGGVHFSSAASAVISRCGITINRTPTGTAGGIRADTGVGRLLVQNCLVAYNSSPGSGDPYYGLGGCGIYVMGTNALIENCTIVSNFLGGKQGAGLYATNTDVRVVNSIIYHNSGVTSSNIYVSAVNCIFSNSCAAPPPALGTANTDANPQFVAKDTGNFRLNNNSPCINTGMNQGWMTGMVDLEGRQRIRYGTVDIGAYERIHSGTTYGLR